MSALHIAVKQLTSSDLSFFDGHLRFSKQKGINLNRDVFVDQFFPSLSGSFETIHFTLTIIGPGGAKPFSVSRKILRTPGAKNWRLNGEIVRNPDEEPGRFASLTPGDLAIFAFEGHDRPEAVSLILVSRAVDKNLHDVLRTSITMAGRTTMAVTSFAEVTSYRLVTEQTYSGFHPLEVLDQPDTLEEVLFESQSDIGSSGEFFVERYPSLTTEQLQRQLQAAHETGLNGEELFHNWLVTTGHTDEQVEWISNLYARAPYDFKVQTPRWNSNLKEVFVDVKTTKSVFGKEFHVSIAEMKFAASNESYRVARIFQSEEPEPKMKLLSGLTEIAQETLRCIQQFPESVTPDSFRINPDFLTVETEVTLTSLREDSFDD